MAKKIEVDIAYLKSIGLSQKQISDIIKNSEPDHWTNELPQGNFCFELLPFMITPESRAKQMVAISCKNQHDPLLSFFTEEDAEFIQNKCRLLMEMSNFSFAVNKSWCPDWNNKDEKKYGIVLQNGMAKVSENELFNVYVFGIVTKSLSLALEMLEEFKNRIETYFNKPYNSINEKINEQEILSLTGGVIGVDGSETNVRAEGRCDNDSTNGTINDTDFNTDFIGSLTPTAERIRAKIKRRKITEEDIPKIQEMLLNNVRQKDIAVTFGYSESSISVLKKRLGFVMLNRMIKSQD
jgi:DNA-binding CsgD family transcriptional regulator